MRHGAPGGIISVKWQLALGGCAAAKMQRRRARLDSRFTGVKSASPPLLFSTAGLLSGRVVHIGPFLVSLKQAGSFIPHSAKYYFLSWSLVCC